MGGVGVGGKIIERDNGKEEVTHYCKNYPDLDSNRAG